MKDCKAHDCIRHHKIYTRFMIKSGFGDGLPYDHWDCLKRHFSFFFRRAVQRSTRLDRVTYMLLESWSCTSLTRLLLYEQCRRLACRQRGINHIVELQRAIVQYKKYVKKKGIREGKEFLLRLYIYNYTLYGLYFYFFVI